MKREIAEEMLFHVNKFMADFGFYPAMKEREEEILSLEERLYNRLRRAQTGLESAFIRALRERGYLPSNPAEQAAFIDLILNASFEEMSEMISAEGIISAEIGRQLTMDDLILQGMQITVAAFSPFVAEEIQDRIYTFSTDTFNRIKGDFAMTLTKAYTDGVGIDEAARMIRNDFSGLRDHRLKTIARTEIQGAQNIGIAETMNEFDVQYKQWITVGDSRVRGRDPDDQFDHVVLHGEVVRRTEAFSNGLMHPLDRSGDIGNWINCRCRMRPYIPRRGETIISTPYYPSAA